MAAAARLAMLPMVGRAMTAAGGVVRRRARAFGTDLREEWPGVPQLLPARQLPPPRCEVSSLPNGLRVVSCDTYSQVASLGIFIDGGSMYERDSTLGASHFLEVMTGKASATRSRDEVRAFAQRHGLGMVAVFNREAMMFKAECLRGSADAALELLADCVFSPRLADEELEAARGVIAVQRDEQLSMPAVVVSEHLHRAAYGDASPLGRSEKCPQSAVGAVTADTLLAHMRRHYVAPRVVLTAVGLDHETAVDLARRYLSAVPGHNAESQSVRRPTATYLGGDVRSSPDWAAMPATITASSINAKTDFTHLMMAFPTVGWADDDVVPVCVADTLLGGGSSFSAGGPGKGMYTRLYLQVLNQYAWAESANAFSTQLYDTGLVGVYGTAAPPMAGRLSELLAGHLARLTNELVTDEELARARKQLASSVLMNLETRGLLLEDIGRQYLCHGKRMEPSILLQRIQAVTAEDLRRVMRLALVHPPAFAAVGDTSTLPTYDVVRDYFAGVAARIHVSDAAGTTLARGGRLAAGSRSSATAAHATAAGRSSAVRLQYGSGDRAASTATRQASAHGAGRADAGSLEGVDPDSLR